MKRWANLIMILLMALLPQCVWAGPTKYKNFCLEADSLCKSGKQEEAINKITNCLVGCPSCKKRYVEGSGCLHIIWRDMALRNNDAEEQKKKPKNEEVAVITISKSESESVQGTTVSSNNSSPSTKVDTVVTTYYRTDTLYFTDNSHLVHPYGIKSWRMEKKTWRWTFNSIGVAAVGGSIGMGIMASRNYKAHVANTASTRREHQQYYKDYKLYSGLMGGCIALAVAALSANVFYIQVKNDVRIEPGLWVDLQGNAQVSLNVKF